jgi:hypothetical protein
LLRSLPVAFAALFVLIGCVNVAPAPSTESSTAPSVVGSAAPSLGVTTPAPQTPAATLLTPTVAPTLVPTAPPLATDTPAATEQPTIAPSVGPSGLATEGPSAQPTAGTADRDQIFTDDMSDPASGWQQLNEDFASITYDSGVMAFRYNQDQAWAYTVRHLDTPETTLLPAADFSPQSEGIFGVLCGDSASGRLYGAVVGTDGTLVFLETDSGAINVLDRQDKLDLDVKVGDSNPMALECHADGTGGLTMIAGLSGTGPIATYHADTDAPSSFDVVGLYGEATADDYTLTVDLASLYGLGGADNTTSDGAQILLAHIPTDFQNNCWESPIFAEPADYKITCVPQSSGKGAEIERYLQFADKPSMDASYQDVVDAFGVESTGSCKSGPNETGWSTNDQPGGRVECAPQKVGIRFDWTDDLTSILAGLIDFEGSYKDTYDQWVNAGPIIPQG